MVDTDEAVRCGDVGVGELKAESIFLGLEGRKKKQARLLRKAQGVQRKVLQKKTPLEEASRKR